MQKYIFFPTYKVQAFLFNTLLRLLSLFLFMPAKIRKKKQNSKICFVYSDILRNFAA